MKIITIIGARPQFIKASAINRQLRSMRGIHEVLVYTGQHYDPEMSDVFFEELDIQAPGYNLGIHGGGHGEMTGKMLIEIDAVLLSERPDAVLVYGDTNSTLAGALAASKLHIPVVHVEAGLRSFNRIMPEEINRVLTDHISTLLFCPTSTSVRNLEVEGIKQGVYHVGDVMYDVAMHTRKRAENLSTIVDRLNLNRDHYVVATVHRAENTDDPTLLKNILNYLQKNAGDHLIIFPLHPRTRASIKRHGLSLDGFNVVPPLGYLDMTQLVANAACIYTDSGGLQKEAYFHRVPCVTLRTETEWVETIEAGWNRLWCGPEFVTTRREIFDYGEGVTAQRIISIILKEFVE